MTTTAVLESLIRLGASVAITPECALTIRAPKGALTPGFLATVRAGKEELLTALLTWDRPLAESLLRAVLARVATAYVPTWRRRYADDAPRWLEVEGRIEAAALTRDMLAFVGALVAYERFALNDVLDVEAGGGTVSVRFRRLPARIRRRRPGWAVTPGGCKSLGTWP